MKISTLNAAVFRFLILPASIFCMPVLPAPAFAGDVAAVSESPWSTDVGVFRGRAGEALTEFDYGDPTEAEQGHLEALNRARMNPHGEAALFGFDLFEGVMPGDISGEPVQPLTFNARLYRTAQLHSEDMLARQFFDHFNPDGDDPGDRITAQGYQFRTAGENLAVRGSTAPIDEYETVIRMHEDLFVDEGIENRGHRVNILNENFKEVGIGVRFGQFDYSVVDPQGSILPNNYMLTANFGASRVDGRPFILGVVIDDQDGDGFYSRGEGIGGIEIALVEAGVRTVTATAGGYGLPVAAGTYTVQARHPDGRVASRQITIGDSNVKVDFLLSELSLAGSPPAAVILADGQASTTIGAGNPVTLSLGLDAGGSGGVSGDWWFVQVVDGEILSFDLGTFGFLSGPLLPSLQETPLVGFDVVPVVTVTPPQGLHLFCFGVDLDGNGILDVGSLHFSCAEVIAM